MLDHVSLGVRDIVRSRHFYCWRSVCSDWCASSISAPITARRRYALGVGIIITHVPQPENSDCWRTYLLPRARSSVRAFHAAAIAAGRRQAHLRETVVPPARRTNAWSVGGSDDGVPGLRPQYHADYYGAFIRDPDRPRIEAVCHGRKLRSSLLNAEQLSTNTTAASGIGLSAKPGISSPQGLRRLSRRDTKQKPRRLSSADSRHFRAFGNGLQTFSLVKCRPFVETSIIFAGLSAGRAFGFTRCRYQMGE
jgi:catechol 2,3-dioxygenase-like lactoylglutathione lyase family enzyme